MAMIVASTILLWPVPSSIWLCTGFFPVSALYLAVAGGAPVAAQDSGGIVIHKTTGDEGSSSPAAIIKGSDDAIISKDLRGITTSWNAGAQRLFGYTPQEAIGLPITIIVPVELQDEEEQIIERVHRGERVEHWETVRCRKDGSRLDVSLSISPISDSEGHIIGVSTIARDVTDRKQADAVQKETELSGRLLELQDEERRRIARELHDGVGQLLTAVTMNNSAVVEEKDKLSPAAARCVEENASLIQQALADIRKVSHLLHPPLLEEAGLNWCLEEYINAFAERSKIAARLEMPAEFGRLPQSHELCLFRIAQECLTNVHRHSGSAMALVRLSRTPVEVKLEVIDEGHGMGPKTRSTILSGTSPGLGLRGMRERLKLLGGRLDVLSNSHGTVVSATLPLENAK